MKIDYPVMHANDCLTRSGGPCNCRCTLFSEEEFNGLTPRQQEAVIRLKARKPEVNYDGRYAAYLHPAECLCYECRYRRGIDAVLRAGIRAPAEAEALAKSLIEASRTPEEKL